MLIVGFLVLWASYTAIYVGLYRITGDKRPVSAIFLGTAS